MGVKNRRKRGVGTVIGGTIFILILLLGFSTLFAILSANNDYNQTMVQMTQFDLERQSERLTVDSTFFIGNSYGIYRSNTGLNALFSPKTRLWSGTAWGSEKELPSSGSPVRWIRTAYSPISSRDYEVIVATLSDDGLIDVFVWTGTSWSATYDIGNVGTTANVYRPFDVAYEKTSGRALLVYGLLSSDTSRDMAYRIWDGVSWSGEHYINIALGTETDLQVNWLALATKPTSGSNTLGLISLTSNSRAEVFIWDGSSWGNQHDLTTTASIVTEESIALGWETSSGALMVVAGEGTAGNIRWNRFTTSWGTSSTLDIVAQANPVNWLTLKSDSVSTSNYLMIASIDGAQDFVTVFWNGAAWTATSHDNRVDTHASRDGDFEWEPTGSRGLLAWATTTGPNTRIGWKTFTAPSTYGTVTFQNVGSNPHAWVRLARNPLTTATIKLLGAFLESTANDLGAITWDGTSFTVVGAATFTAESSSSTFESFSIVFQSSGASGIRAKFTNSGPQAIHVISTWTVNSTAATQYDQDLWLAAGETNSIVISYTWFQGQYSVRAITERGNVIVGASTVQ